MDNFIAIDVETANNQPSSICAIGAVKVVDGVIADRFYQLVKPEPEWYIRHFSEEIHGIFPEDTRDAPTFDRVWMSMLEHFGIAGNWDNAVFVAHNKAFDERCLRAAFKVYGMTWPEDALCRKPAARYRDNLWGAIRFLTCVNLWEYLFITITTLWPTPRLVLK